MSARSYYAANADKVKTKERERYAINRDKILERKRELYAANRERILEQRRAWHLANPEKRRQYIDRSISRMNPDYKREYDRARYLAKRDEVLARSRAWRIANPEKIGELRARRRAIRLGLPLEDFPPLEIFQRDNWNCGICGQAIDSTLKWPDVWSVTLDHIIPISKGGSHVRANVQSAHAVCNVRKSDRVPVTSNQ